MAVTLKQIASQLGVSVSTVSYAINGGPRAVKDDIRDKVLATAKALDYRPNTIAKSLVTRRTRTIGIVPTEASANLTSSPYFQGCLQGVVNEAEAQGQDVLLYTRFDQSITDRFLSTILDGRADGVIFLAPKVDSPVVDWLEGRLPAVVVSSHRFPGTPSRNIDNFGGVKLVIDYLIELGHTKIGHVHGHLLVDDGFERLEAFKKCIVSRGLRLEDQWIVDGRFTPEGGYAAGKKLLTQGEPPTAVFCGNDDSAVGLMRAVTELGIKVPQDLSVVGFDDAAAATFSFPQLTTIKQPLELIGASALRDLVCLIEGRPIPGHQSFATELVIRNSTDRPKEDS